MKTKTLSLIGLFCITLFYQVMGQIPSERRYDPQKTIKNELISALQTKYGRTYKVSYHIMDSLIAHSRDGNFTDPYGTLAGCVLFSASVDWGVRDSTITGMLKNGQIVWDDYPGTNAGFGGMLLTTKDINKDGDVDILEAESDFDRMTREGSGISYLWILSWNGTTGRFINEVDSITHQSTLVSTDKWYDVVDINHDGILEIRGEISHWQEDFPNLNPTTLPSITYSWNGSKYGFFASAHQISADEFYPADLMGVSIHCIVIKNNNSYTYSYSILNHDTSVQSIDDIYIEGLVDTSSIFAPSGWSASSSRYIGGRFFYNSTFELSGVVGPGHSLDSFGTVSVSPPAIVKYHVQGYREYGQTATDDEYRNDIQSNSVSGYTVGTTDTTQQFVPMNRFDTLRTYINQARSIGWILDQPTADKFTTLLDSAKSQFQQNNVRESRAKLDTVMQQANQDSSETLSSEAYALIYFISQYLLSQLPLPPPQYNLNVNTIGNGSVGLSPNRTLVDSGTSIQLTASPSSGYTFSGWSGDASGSDNPLSIIMNANKSITATFIQTTFIITANAEANGIISPNGAVSVNYGSSRGFSITPNTGYHVDSIIVDGIKTDSTTSYTFTNVTDNHDVTAKFAINQYSITASSGTNGSINPSGNIQVNYGSSSAFSLIPNSCYHVDSLIVDGIKVDSTTSYTFVSVSTNHTIRSVFKINTDSLIVNLTGSGSVSKTPNQTTFTCGATVQLFASASEGYYFSGWSGDTTGTANPITISMNRNKTVTSTFTGITFTISAMAYSGGTISPNGDVSIPYNGNQTFSIRPNTGYHVSSLMIDDDMVPVDTTYTFNSVMEDHSIKAHFGINTYTLTTGVTGTGSVTKSPSQSNYNYGTSVQLTANPGSCYHFVNWTGDLSGSTNPASITMDNNKTVTANFAINLDTLTLTASPSGGGTQSKNPDQSGYNCGASVQITANPATGYQFANWSGGYSGSSNPVSVTLTSNLNVTANYNLLAPTVTSFTPTTGGVGATVTITGTNFVNITSVKFNNTSATNYTVNSSTQITAIVPTGTTTGTISVTNAAGTGTSSTNFTYTSATYTLTVGVSGSGSVSKNPNASSYASGVIVQLTATPGSQYGFDHWSGSVSSYSNPINVTMDGNKSVTATFIHQDYRPGH